MKFMGFSKSNLPVRFAALALVGAFVASLGVVALPSEAEARRANVWSVKFKCSEDTDDLIELDSNPFAVDDFFLQTIVNIHNPGDRTIRFNKKVVVALRQSDIDSDNDPSDNVSALDGETLGPNEALALDCEDIRKVFNDSVRFGEDDHFDLVEGFVVIESERGSSTPDLAVCANYMLVSRPSRFDTSGGDEVTGLALHNQCYKPLRVRVRGKFVLAP